MDHHPKSTLLLSRAQAGKEVLLYFTQPLPVPYLIIFLELYGCCELGLRNSCEPNWLKLVEKLGRSICLLFERLHLRCSYFCAIFSSTWYSKKISFPSEPILGLLVPKTCCKVKITGSEESALNSCEAKRDENQWLEVEAGQIKTG